jgi:SAM-dependent methyltransferase
MEIPGYGVVNGEWDLRPNIDRYLGHYVFRGKRVLDVGAASGFLSLHMEKAGAEVVSYDLSEAHPWDIVPFSGTVDGPTDADRRKHVRRINNGYWLAHRVLGSKAKVVYGTVYDMPESIGAVDVALYGSILLHLRDPFLALENGARRAREAIIVADIAPLGLFGRFLKRPVFVPVHQRPQHWDVWWLLPPRLVVEYLAILGLKHATITWHRQLFRNQSRWLYTVVASRSPGRL